MVMRQWGMGAALLGVAVFAGCQESAMDEVQDEQEDVIEAEQELNEEEADLNQAENEAAMENEELGQAPALGDDPVMTPPGTPDVPAPAETVPPSDNPFDTPTESTTPPPAPEEDPVDGAAVSEDAESAVDAAQEESVTPATTE